MEKRGDVFFSYILLKRSRVILIYIFIVGALKCLSAWVVYN